MKRKSVIALAASVVLGTSILIAGASGFGNADNKKTETNTDYVSLFSDVTPSDWFYDDIKYVQEHNLMTGTGENKFSPDSNTTRGMIVTILWRLENKPTGIGRGFEDVGNDAYYHYAVIWASNNEIVSGYSDKLFGPEDIATREQLATIMYRYAQHKKYDVSKSNELDKYSDKEQISEYALDGIKWANATGLITGTSDTTISPKDNVQRSQVAAILKRFCLNISNRKDNTVSDETETDVDNIDKTEKDVSSKTDGLKENDNNHKENTPVTNMESTSPEIIVDSIEAKPGDEIQIPVSIKNNPGILGMTLTLYYDENQCTLEKVENGAALNGILDFTTSKTLNSGARFVWDGVEISNDDVKDGEIIILTFKIDENAHDGSCPITLKYFEDDIIDNNLSGIYPYIKNGEIKISD